MIVLKEKNEGKINIIKETENLSSMKKYLEDNIEDITSFKLEDINKLPKFKEIQEKREYYEKLERFFCGLEYFDETVDTMNYGLSILDYSWWSLYVEDTENPQEDEE